MSGAPRRKLIEVALPLEGISEASISEKSPFTRGHPRSLHYWWARRPLAACRAVVLGSLIDDPSSHPDQFTSEEDQEVERARLLQLVEDLVPWSAMKDESLLRRAQEEIKRSFHDQLPVVLDPFCGGGSLLLEAQRFGLEVRGSDLNPVAVLVTKGLIEIPYRFRDLPPVSAPAEGTFDLEDWSGAMGLAADVVHYGEWLLSEARTKLQDLYPPSHGPAGEKTPSIAWIWARTTTCANPACGGELPLVRSFLLSKKEKTRAWVEPIVVDGESSIEFQVRTGEGDIPPGTVSASGAICPACKEMIRFADLREQGRKFGFGTKLMAVVQKVPGGKSYSAPTDDQVQVAGSAPYTDALESDLPTQGALGFRVQAYGLKKHRDLFTDRQLYALTVLSDLVKSAGAVATQDAKGRLPNDKEALEKGGKGPRAYGEAISIYLGLAVSRLVDFSSTISTWDSGNTNLRQFTARQAVPMTWDFAETNPLDGVVSFSSAVGWVATGLRATAPRAPGSVENIDAASISPDRPVAIVTDPPYYDNIGYGDLSDVFYVWIRRALRDVCPDLLSTLLTPKQAELIADPSRFEGDRKAARTHFEIGLKEFFDRAFDAQRDDVPFTLFYAFKQDEANEDGIASTGWETMLDGLLSAGFAVTGTWPMRTEQAQRFRADGSNALASSIVMACRRRDSDAPLATRKEFAAALRAELPEAVRALQEGAIAPVDLAQAAIGPGMGIFSRYGMVVEADGKPMRIRTALAMINQALDERLAEQEADFDPDTRWCIAWFEQHGLDDGPFGLAETLSRAKNTSVKGLVEAGVLSSVAGRVRLLARSELDPDWDPSVDKRLTVWEVAQHMIQRLDEGGEESAADLVRQIGGLTEPARELAYRLFQICDRKQWAQEGLAYNRIAAAWPEVVRLAAAREPPGPGAQGSLV